MASRPLPRRADHDLAHARVLGLIVGEQDRAGDVLGLGDGGAQGIEVGDVDLAAERVLEAEGLAAVDPAREQQRG